jgi:hypothetical protein
MAAPHPGDVGGLAVAGADAAVVTSPNGNTGPTNPPPPSTPSVSDPQHLGSPASPLPIAGTADQAPYTVPGGTPGTPPWTLLPLPGDLDPDQPPIPSPPRSNILTPKTIPTQPLSPSARNSAFDLTGVRGDFILEDTRVYWESVPGGEKWVKMVTSYLMLETMAPLKSVRTVLLYSFTTN